MMTYARARKWLIVYAKRKYTDGLYIDVEEYNALALLIDNFLKLRGARERLCFPTREINSFATVTNGFAS